MAEVKNACRLYFQFPVQASAAREAQLLQSVVNTDVACVLLNFGGQDAEERQVRHLVELVQAQGIACLIDRNAELAARVEADGVHLDADPETYAEARRILGVEANVGVGCGLSRHDAMNLAELGADYVAFGLEGASNIDNIDQRAERVAWWTELFVVPCVAWNVESPKEAERLAALGADFVAPSARIWHEEGSAEIIGEIDKVLRRTRRAA